MGEDTINFVLRVETGHVGELGSHENPSEGRRPLFFLILSALFFVSFLVTFKFLILHTSENPPHIVLFTHNSSGHYLQTTSQEIWAVLDSGKKNYYMFKFQKVMGRKRIIHLL